MSWPPNPKNVLKILFWPKNLCFLSPARVLPADIPLVVRAEGVGADRGEPQAAGLQQGGRLCTEHWSRDLTHLGGHGLRGLPVAPLHQLLDGELPGRHNQVPPQDVDWLQGEGQVRRTNLREV